MSTIDTVLKTSAAVCITTTTLLLGTVTLGVVKYGPGLVRSATRACDGFSRATHSVEKVTDNLNICVEEIQGSLSKSNEAFKIALDKFIVQLEAFDFDKFLENHKEQINVVYGLLLKATNVIIEKFSKLDMDGVNDALKNFNDIKEVLEKNLTNGDGKITAKECWNAFLYAGKSAIKSFAKSDSKS